MWVDDMYYNHIIFSPLVPIGLTMKFDTLPSKNNKNNIKIPLHYHVKVSI